MKLKYLSENIGAWIEQGIRLNRHYGLKKSWRVWFDKKYRRVLFKRKRSQRRKRIYGAKFLNHRRQLKEKLYVLQRGRCAKCQRYLPRRVLTIDHIKKLSDGGKSDIDNLQLLCRICHDFKDNMIPIRLKSNFENKPFAEFFRK